MGRSCKTCISLEHILFSQAVFADQPLTLGIAIFSKTTAHGHFFKNLASRLFTTANNVLCLPPASACPANRHLIKTPYLYTVLL